MNEFDQQPFPDIELAENAEPRCPCVLLLDNSASMTGAPIEELNNGLKVFEEELKSDSLAAKRVEVAVVSFGPVRVQQDFITARDFYASPLQPDGNTPMGHAIETAATMLQQRKERYRANGIAYYRPWIFLITDGAPTDSITNATQLIRNGESDKSFMFFPVGIENADMGTLKSLSTVREPLKMKGLMFREFFMWLSSSLGSVSQSNPGDTVALPSPTEGPTGWATVG